MNIRNGLDLITEDTYGFIYITTNMVNGKRYIGRKTVDKHGQWKRYIGSGYGITRAIKKYGTKNFYKDIVDTADSYEELDEKEKFWIAKYDAVHDDNFYNIAAGGRGAILDRESGLKKNQEAKLRHSQGVQRRAGNAERAHFKANLMPREAVEVVERLKRGDFVKDIAKDYNVRDNVIHSIRCHVSWKSLTKDIVFPTADEMRNKKECKAVLQYDLYGNFIKRHNSTRDAARYINAKDLNQISRCLRSKYKVSNGYLWCYVDDKETQEIINDPVKMLNIRKYAKQHCNKHKEKQEASNKRKVAQYSLEDVLIAVYDSLVEASEATGASIPNIVKVCKGERNKTKGYKWRYADNEECGDLKYGTA